VKSGLGMNKFLNNSLDIEELKQNRKFHREMQRNLNSSFDLHNLEPKSTGKDRYTYRLKASTLAAVECSAEVQSRNLKSSLEMTLVPSKKETSNLWKSTETTSKFTSKTAMLKHNLKQLKPITIDPFVAKRFGTK
jgi:hypothetical protein